MRVAIGWPIPIADPDFDGLHPIEPILDVDNESVNAMIGGVPDHPGWLKIHMDMLIFCDRTEERERAFLVIPVQKLSLFAESGTKHVFTAHNDFGVA
jgi:hypothetical protein